LPARAPDRISAVGSDRFTPVGGAVGRSSVTLRAYACVHLRTHVRSGSMFSRVGALFLVGLLSLLSACGLLRAAHDPRVALFECRVAALEPLVGDVLEADALARDIYAGRANLSAVLEHLQATRSEVEDLAARLASCDPVPEAPPAEPSPPRVTAALIDAGVQ
jgi:hypothetical protein